MTMTDPIADKITRLRNGYRARHERVLVPKSRIKEQLARILKEEGFIQDYVVHADGPQGHLTLLLRYGADGEGAVREIRRVSRPGLRRYAGSQEIPKVLGGQGISVLSTSRGLMVDRQARKRRLGGEILCTVY